jgi:hypothetical protein
MPWRLVLIAAASALAGCAGVEPDRAPVVTPAEVTVVSDYIPVKAAVVPLIRELGYAVEQDAQYWTIFGKPGSPPTRLTVTFASIHTHTRVIADTQLLVSTPQGIQPVPAPTHPDRAALQAALDRAKREVERQPLAERRRTAAPTNVPAMPNAPRATVAPAQGGAVPAAAPPAPDTTSIFRLPTFSLPGTTMGPAPVPRPASQPPLQPGQTRISL